MKKYEFSKLALLGIASGLMALGEPELDANAIDVQNLIAKPACKGKGGCGGLTAERDLPKDALDDEDVDSDDEDVEEIDEEEEVNSKHRTHKKT